MSSSPGTRLSAPVPDPIDTFIIVESMMTTKTAGGSRMRKPASSLGGRIHQP